MLRGELDDARDLFGRGGKNDDIGAAFFDGAVVFVKQEIFRPRKNGRRAEKFFQFANEARVHRARAVAHLHYSEVFGMGAT
jgi:hypothetical protein